MKNKILFIGILLFSFVLFSCDENENQREETIQFLSKQYEKRKEKLDSLIKLRRYARELYKSNKSISPKERVLERFQNDIFWDEVYNEYLMKIDLKDSLFSEKENAFRLYSAFFKKTKFKTRTKFNSLKDLEVLDDKLIVLKLKLDVLNAYLEAFDAFVNKKHYDNFRKIEEKVATNPYLKYELIEQESGAYSVFLEQEELTKSSFIRNIEIEEIVNQNGVIVTPKIDIHYILGYGFISNNFKPEENDKHRFKAKFDKESSEIFLLSR
ncbi:hypothetical protein [Aureivirga sp. CE67]|uniref:hypothetical protein n=1 Tax=Aureivirga sp. CE67 TaxID=1788983 RepID=UPI0018CBA864|nr:hypothetical protein [Aureivirga sp. CE67]